MIRDYILIKAGKILPISIFIQGGVALFVQEIDKVKSDAMSLLKPFDIFKLLYYKGNIKQGYGYFCRIYLFKGYESCFN